MSAVWERSRAKGGDKLLLLAIADHADDDGKNAFPSNELLCEKCGGVDESTIRRGLARLKRLGELKVFPNAGGTPEWRRKHPDKCPNLYEITLPHRTRKATKARHDRGSAERTPDHESTNATPVVPQVAGSPSAQPDGGGAERTPATPAERGCVDARDGGAFLHERGCVDAPQTIQEPSTEPSTPPNPHDVGAQGRRVDGTNPRARHDAPRDRGTNPRAGEYDAFFATARRDDTDPVLVGAHLARMRDALDRGLDVGPDIEGARP